MVNLSKDVKVTRLMNAVNAGMTQQNGTVLDMSGFEGVIFIALFGTLSAGTVSGLKAQQGIIADGSDMKDLKDTMVYVSATGSNKMVVLDLYCPEKRYVRCAVVRTVANAAIDGVIAMQYKTRRLPTVQDLSVDSSKIVISPDEGTA